MKYGRGFTSTPKYFGVSLQDQRGFTLLETLVVITIILILVAIVFASLVISQKRARDNRRISQMREIILGLEQYRDVCKEYPLDLSVDVQAETGSNNGCPGFPELISLYDFFPAGLPVNPEGSLSPDEIGWHYVSLRVSDSHSSACTGYHLGVLLETEHPDTRIDSDFSSTDLFDAGLERCPNAPLRSEFVGYSSNCGNFLDADTSKDHCYDERR